MTVAPATLRWSSPDPSVRQRVVVRDPDNGKTLKLEVATGAVSLDVDPAPLAGSRPPTWRVEVADGGTWQPATPYLRWPAPPAGPKTVFTWDDGELIHRVLIHDDTIRENVRKDAEIGAEFVLDWSGLPPHHRYRYRAQVWRDGAWADLEPYAMIEHPGLGVSVSADREPADAATARVLFLWTCDVEANVHYVPEPTPQHAIDQHIWGVMDGRRVGIELQMDMLEEHGFRGTFFVDVLSEHQFGEGSLQPVFDAILGRGHDVQLHLHPKPNLRLAADRSLHPLQEATETGDPQVFRAAMEVAMELFERRAGYLPVAYRAGGYRIFDEHFAVLRDLGFLVDSSVYPFKNSEVREWVALRTQPFWVEGVLEVPITWYAVRDRGQWRTPEQLSPARHGDVQHRALEAAAAVATTGGPPLTVCYIAHSYSFLTKQRTTDPAHRRAWMAAWRAMVGDDEYREDMYDPGDEMLVMRGVDEARISVMREAFARLAKHPHVAGISLRELARERAASWPEHISPTDPVVCVDDRDAGTATLPVRRYGADLLAALEAR